MQTIKSVPPELIGVKKYSSPTSST